MNGLLENLFILIFFGLTPMILGVFLPSFLVSLLVKKILFKKITLKPIITFAIFATILSIGTNFVWERYIFNVFYKEWDRVFLPFTFFYHETPVNDNPAISTLLKGWTFQDLYLVWLIFDILTITLALGATLFLYRKRKEYKLIQKTLLISFLLLVIAGCIVNLLPSSVKVIFLNPFFMVMNLIQGIF